MAFPTYSPSGSVSLNVNVNASVATGASVLTAYNIPLSASPIQASIYSGSTTTGSGTISRVLQLSGTLTGSAASAVVASLSTTGATQDIVGNTAVWNHVREVIVFNDGNTSGFTAGTDGSILTWDFSTTVANVWGITSTTNSGAAPVIGTATASTPQIQIPAGSYQRFSKPWGANGWTVGSTNSYVIVLGTPGAVTTSLNYRIIVMGD